jgi:hypothetical protein
MTDIGALEAAILNKDPDGVVTALSEWDEQQRKAARKSFNVLMMALGMDDNVAEPCDMKPDHPDVLAKRKRDGLTPMSRKERTYDYDLSHIARLARYGISGSDHCTQRLCLSYHPRESAQILADRRPPRWNEWFDAMMHRESNLTAPFLALLYERDLWSADAFGRVAKWFAADLPGALAQAPEATQKLLREVEACRSLVYEVRKDTYQLFNASDWVPVIDWLRSAKLLDAPQLLSGVLDALHEPFNQTERNGAVMLAKAAKANGKILAEHQARWAGLNALA